MRRLALILTLSVALFITGVCTPSAHAASFNAGNIIDDAIFTNNSSMSVDQIQSFLNSKVPTCDTNGTMPASDFGRPDLTHAQYAASRGWSAPPYTCLKDYAENGVSSAQLIYNLSQQYQINPQVFIVTLQKESSLVTDYWPLLSQYRTATGYGCPDSGPNNSANCSSTYYGFTNQLTWTAKMYRAVLNQSPTWYSPYVVGTNYIQWSPTASCGGTNVNIQNWSTAALYDYTPYQPNAAALNAGYGMGDSCSAYGNRNFFLYFNDWFGDTHLSAGALSIKERYELLGGPQSTLGTATSSVVCGLKGNGCYQNYQNGAILWNSSTGAWENYGPVRARYQQMGYETSPLGYPVSAVTCGLKNDGCYQNYQNGAIVWSPASGAWDSKGYIRKHWALLGFENSTLGYPTGPEVWNGKGWWQNYQNGAIIGTDATGYWESTGPIRARWAELKFETGSLGYPTSDLICGLKDNGCYQNYQNGAILWSSASGAWESKGGIRTRWAQLGFENSALGYPTSAVTCGIKGNGCFQNYQNGAILQSNGTGAWENYGPVRSQYQQLGYETSSLGYPNGPIKVTASTNSQTFAHGAISCDSSSNCQVTSY